jgi:hypothetical protein
MPSLRVLIIGAAASLIELCGASGIAAQCSPGRVDASFVGVVAGNPFQAETLTTMTFGPEGSASALQKRGTVSRDSQGRIRIERVTGTYKMANGAEAGKAVELKVITICDPVTRTLTQLDPLGKTAKVWLPSASDKEGTFNTSQNYCELLSGFKDAHAESFVDLGHRTIAGFATEGIRQILEPRRIDASGNEIAEKMDEQWCAPDLQAVVLRVFRSDFVEVVELKNIERGEPDSALFEIPRDYTIVEKTASAMSPSSASPMAATGTGCHDSKKNPCWQVAESQQRFTEFAASRIQRAGIRRGRLRA